MPFGVEGRVCHCSAAGLTDPSREMCIVVIPLRNQVVLIELLILRDGYDGKVGLLGRKDCVEEPVTHGDPFPQDGDSSMPPVLCE